MADKNNYIIPGVYSQNTPATVSAVDSSNILTSVLVGTALRGASNLAVKATSWTQFCSEFARGFESPYFADSYLAHCAYGYYQNGGDNLYVIRVASKDAKCATVTQGTGATFTAKDEGAWGNSIEIKIAEAENGFNLSVISLLKGNRETVESYTLLSNDPTNPKYYARVINQSSKYITVTVGDTGLSSTTEDSNLVLQGGVDGTITPANLKTALEVGLKGVQWDTVAHTFDGDEYNEVLSKFLEEKEALLGVTNLPKDTNSETFITSLGKCKGNINVYHPWVSITDPLSDVSADMLIPNVGHVLGTATRVVKNSGVWKSPAGTSAYIKGVNSVQMFEESELEAFYSENVNCLIEKPEYGILIWGARTQSDDKRFKYSSSVLLDNYVRRAVKEITTFAVFEPNNPYLWLRVEMAVKEFLNNLWKLGGLAGNIAEDAYFVQCDNTLNTAETIAEGKLYCNVGYAKDVPAEFIIFCFTHSMD